MTNAQLATLIFAELSIVAVVLAIQLHVRSGHTLRSPISMFIEKRDGVDDWSMTRVIIAALATAFVYRVFRFSVTPVAFGAPDAVAIFAITFAIPFSKLFEGAHGAKLLGKFIDRLGIGAPGVNAVTQTETVQHRTEIETNGQAPIRRDENDGIEETP